VTADQIRAHLDPIRDQFAEERSLVLPALKFAQTEKGHLTREDLVAVAEATDLTPAYVESIASFYDRIYLDSMGKRVVSVCVSISCMLNGSDELLEHLCSREGLPLEGGTSDDGEITVQEAQCLGACDRAPCLQVDAEETMGPVSFEEADRLRARLRSEPQPSPVLR
jgi:NADH-quinone oxidoreductase subunit E